MSAEYKPIRRKCNVVRPIAPPPDDDDKTQECELTEQLEKCKKSCRVIEDELKQLKEFNDKKSVDGITLNSSKKLIDLLIERILDPDLEWRQKVNMLIDIPHSQSGKVLRGGDYFEALFQLAIAIGAVQGMSGNIEFHDIKKYESLVPFPNYLHTKTIKNSGGGEQGISDITFQIKSGVSKSPVVKGYKCGQIPETVGDDTDAFYFISVKGYKREKSIAKDYDIPVLSKQLDKFPEKTNKKLIICVRNEEQFKKNLDRTRAEFLRSSVYRVIGYNEIMDAFTKFRTDFFIRNPEMKDKAVIAESVHREFPPGVISKPSLSLYFHQELVTNAVMRRIIERKDDATRKHYMCVGVLPRGGKSFIAGGIINEHRKLKSKENYNVLFLTSAVNETREQFKEDLIDKFSDFKDFQFDDVVDRDSSGVPLEDAKPNKFFFVSRQLSSLAGAGAGAAAAVEEEEEKSIQDIFTRLEEGGKIPEIDICFFDEAHVGILAENVDTTLSRMFDKYKCPIILMTATYAKPSNALDSPEDLFVWDLFDVKDMKGLSAKTKEEFILDKPALFERYPNAETILDNRINKGQSTQQIAKPYVNFPEPNFISLTFAPETIRRMSDTGVGYDHARAFQFIQNPAVLNDDSKHAEWGPMLSRRDEAKLIREFLTPDIDEEDSFLKDENRKFRALNQVFEIAHKTGSRPLPGTPFSMIMFMPKLKGMPIGALCRIWASFMLERPYWKNNFVFMTLSAYTGAGYNPSNLSPADAVKRGICSKENFRDLALKDAILTIEYEALKVGKGLVLLSGDVAKMGISLPCVDIVCMMTADSSADDIIQKTYRALTDDPPNKKNGYIIDLNLKRIVSAMLEYDIAKTSKSASGDKVADVPGRIDRILKLCNWGQDPFIRANAGQKDVTDIMGEIRTMVTGRLADEYVGREFSVGSLEEKQKGIILADPDLFEELKKILERTKSTTPKKGNKKIMSEAGEEIPGVESAPAEGGPVSSIVSSPPPAPKSPEIILTPAEVTEKSMKILLTFINALVIKSSELWGEDMTYDKLIKKYKEDKKTAIKPVVCECSTRSCSKTHENLYETAWCELRSYAMAPATTGESYTYNHPTHEEVMKIPEKVFDKSESISIYWDGHIHDLIRSLRKGGKYGGARRKQRKLRTWKNGKHSIRRNGLGRRQTYRNTRHH
uniref:Uncharacterized protein n=1 Tax=viral metagenome TaxID=1070528 RepID=A0A6C0K4W6_9ZZZZ